MIDKTQTALDRAISYAFPSWAVRRRVARAQLSFLNTVSPLRSDRASGPVTGNPESSDDRIPYWDRLKMIDMFDKRVCESPLMAGMIDQFVRNTVPPTGLRPVPQTGNTNLDEELSKRFEDWSETSDIRGYTFWQFQQILLKSVLGHGDAGVNHYLRDGKLQGIPAAKIATPQRHARHEGTLVHQGVYTGRGAAPQGYYIIPRDTYGMYRQDDFRYLSTNRMWMFGRPADFESYRGVSAFLAGYKHLAMCESILKYKEFQTKMASVFGIAIKKDRTKSTSPLSALGRNRAAETRGEAATTDTRADIELFSGMGITLNNDEDIQTIESKLNAGDFEAFIRLVCRFIGVTCGLPLEFVLLDWTQANYYGNRMSAMTGKRAFMDWWTIPARLTRLAYALRASEWIADGTITLPAQYDASPLACRVTLPPPIEVDDEKAIKVQRMKMEANLDTGENYIIAQGDTLNRIITARKKEIDAQRAAGLPIPATFTPGVKLLTEIESAQEPAQT